MNAVAEPFVDEELSKAVIDFEMPPVHVLQPVVWYPQGDTGADPKHGMAVKVDTRSINIMLFERDCWMMPKDGCRHVSDPELQIRRNLKINNGTWDYAPFERDGESRVSELQSTVTELEKRIASLEAKLKEKKKPE